MDAERPAPTIERPDGRGGDQRRPDLADALDLAEFADGAAAEAWTLMTRLLFLDGKPRLPAIAAELDLSPAQAIVLRLLSEPRPMGDLAYTMSCDNSNITGIVDRLEERGLVRRQPAPDDRRVKLIGTTPAGAAVREELGRRLATPPPPLARLAEADAAALRDILRRAVGSRGRDT